MSDSLNLWFKHVDTLPLLKGPLSTTISPATIWDGNAEVCKVGNASTPDRETYMKVASKQQAKIT